MSQWRIGAPVILLGALASYSGGCRTDRAPAGREAKVGPSATSRATTFKRPWLENAWNPETGRGVVTHHQPGEGTLTTSFHVGFPGYTGGLVIGGYGSSGLAWRPERPMPGFPSINVFCAQDESIWDRDEGREYSYGWSENFGTGEDGERMSYVAGRVLEATDERLVLSSENSGGCYHVRKLAATWASSRFWTIASRITNRCDHPVHFDFFTGDDPWLGTYKSSDGDIGWTPQGALRNETRFAPGEFTAGGLWDLGNESLGQTPDAFSSQASFVALDPTLPLPDEANFANRFAHDKTEIDPERPLDNRTMTAMNLGWVERRLGPGESMDVAFALGLAITGDAAVPPPLPQLPQLGDQHWSLWRRFTEPKRGPVRTNAEFAAELVELGVFPKRLQVHGTYHVLNPTSAGVAYTIGFPIAVAEDRAPPPEVLVDGQAVPLRSESPGRIWARFAISIPPMSVKSFSVRYTQPHSGRRAEYIVTSALSWHRPIARAVFRITAAAELGPVRTSYPARRLRCEKGTCVLTIVRQPFAPDRELIIQW